MSDTTNINDLPVNGDSPKTPDFSKPASEQQPMQNPVVVESQNVADTGVPSKHIPSNTMQQQHVMDNVVLNQVDSMDNNMYDDRDIYNLSQNAVKSLKKKNESANMLSIDNVLEPILYGLLYFLFQLPVVRELFKKYVKFGYLEDGNMNLSGYIFHSLVFGSVVYMIGHMKEHFL